MESWDAVVIGAGPNGLVAANMLADAGWDVLVLDAQDEPGGAVRTAQVTAPGYRWLAAPVSDAELDAAHVTNAVFDAHRDDPEFDYRFLADEVRAAGHDVCDRTVWRICRDNGWFHFSLRARPVNGGKAQAGFEAFGRSQRRPERPWTRCASKTG